MSESRRRELRAAWLPGEGPGAGIRPRTRLHATAATRFQRDVHEDAAVHRDARNPSRCALERRCSRHGAGLRLHPRRDRGAPPTRAPGPASARSIRPGCRREDRESRPPLPYGRLAQPLLPGDAEARAQGPRPRKRSGATRIDDPRTSAPIGNGPFLLQSWERGRQITLVRNPRYWGPHTAYLDRIVIRFCRPCPLLPAPAEVLAGLRQGEVDMVVYARPGGHSGAP